MYALAASKLYEIINKLLSQKLAPLLPPKKEDVDPRPAVVDEAEFEESDIVDVRARSFPASPNFFDHGFASQFGEGDEDAWEDEEGDEMGGDPECRTQ